MRVVATASRVPQRWSRPVIALKPFSPWRTCLPIDPDPADSVVRPRFLRPGKPALVVEFGNTVDPASTTGTRIDAACVPTSRGSTRGWFFGPPIAHIMIH